MFVHILHEHLIMKTYKAHKIHKSAQGTNRNNNIDMYNNQSETYRPSLEEFQNTIHVIKKCKLKWFCFIIFFIYLLYKWKFMCMCVCVFLFFFSIWNGILCQNLFRGKTFLPRRKSGHATLKLLFTQYNHSCWKCNVNKKPLQWVSILWWLRVKFTLKKVFTLFHLSLNPIHW